MKYLHFAVFYFFISSFTSVTAQSFFRYNKLEGKLKYYRYSNAKNSSLRFKFTKKHLIEEYNIVYSNYGLDQKIQKIDLNKSDTSSFFSHVDTIDFNHKKGSSDFFILEYLIEPSLGNRFRNDSLLLSKPITFNYKGEKVTKFIIAFLTVNGQKYSGSVIFMKGIPFEVFMKGEKENFYFSLISWD
jgi:hypothetical protein